MADELKGQDKRQGDLVDQKGPTPTSEVERRGKQPTHPLDPQGVGQRESPGQPAGGE